MDTSIFIFQLEENPKYLRLADQVFRWLAVSRATAVTSTITMMELLVHPYRQNDQDRVDGFYALLSTYPHLSWVPATLDIADQAARIRAEYNLRTPDAIQASTAISSGATGLISNDPAFARVDELDVLIFDELLKSAK